ncbi:hypothetical protein C4K37_3379 [Pseudomonas chlororaphis subsp. piscium]|nr:hypothetical protein C4K37_3379 [Pseudomonas chlororaphis subsp. piscium]AZC44314.1 hypothetical protein C4K36_3389 [Pseudomonas chlororaphis subsp. piscium]
MHGIGAIVSLGNDFELLMLKQHFHRRPDEGMIVYNQRFMHLNLTAIRTGNTSDEWAMHYKSMEHITGLCCPDHSVIRQLYRAV